MKEQIKNLIWEFQDEIEEKHGGLATFMGEVVIITLIIVALASLFSS